MRSNCYLVCVCVCVCVCALAPTAYEAAVLTEASAFERLG
jgi:hypothetical protein